MVSSFWIAVLIQSLKTVNDDKLRAQLHLSYEERLSVGFFELEEEKTLESLTATFQYIKGAYEKYRERLFTRAWTSDRTSGRSLELKGGRLRLDIREKFSMMKVVRHWNRLPREATNVPSMEVEGQAGWGFEQLGLVEDG